MREMLIRRDRIRDVVTYLVQRLQRSRRLLWFTTTAENPLQVFVNDRRSGLKVSKRMHDTHETPTVL